MRKKQAGKGPARKNQARNGQTRKGQAERGQTRKGQAQRGQARKNQARTAQARANQSRTTQVRKNQARKGQAQRGQSQRTQSQANLVRTSRARILIPLLIVLAIIAIASVKYVLGRVNEGSAASVEDPTSKFSPVECTADMVEASLTARLNLEGATDTAPPPTPVVFTVTLHNLSDEHPCYLQVGRDAATIDVTSGSDAIASLSTCEGVASEHKQLLLDRGMETSFEWTWNGRRGAGCPGNGALAKEGTYKGVWKTQNGTTAESTAVFELPDIAPKPPPTEQEQQAAEPAPAEGEQVAEQAAGQEQAPAQGEQPAEGQ